MKMLSMAVVGLICAAAASCLGGCFFVFQPALSKETRDVTVPHVEGKALYVESGNGSISVKHHEGQTVHVVAKIAAVSDERLKATKVETTRDGSGNLTVRVVWPERAKSNEGCSFEIEIPQASTLDLRTSNGAIASAGMTGEATLETSNGAVKVTDHKGDVRAQSSNGAIELTRVSGKASAETSNGRIVAWLADDCVGPAELQTSNGSIDLNVSPAFVGRLTAKTSNGSVTVKGAGANVVESSKSRAVVEFANKEGKASKLETSNGTITVTVRDANAAPKPE